MKLALHALTTMHCNCLTEVRIARDLGYEGIEFSVSQFQRYLTNGGHAPAPPAPRARLPTHRSPAAGPARVQRAVRHPGRLPQRPGPGRPPGATRAPGAPG